MNIGALHEIPPRFAYSRNGAASAGQVCIERIYTGEGDVIQWLYKWRYLEVTGVRDISVSSRLISHETLTMPCAVVESSAYSALYPAFTHPISSRTSRANTAVRAVCAMAVLIRGPSMSLLLSFSRSPFVSISLDRSDNRSRVVQQATQPLFRYKYYLCSCSITPSIFHISAPPAAAIIFILQLQRFVSSSPIDSGT